MGKSSAEIEHDLALQREEISARISRLEQRIRDDVDSARERLSSRARAAGDSVTSAAKSATHAVSEKAQSLGDSVPASASTDGFVDGLARHPRGLVLGSAGAGLGLGLLVGGSSDGRDEHTDGRESAKIRTIRHEQPESSGPVGKLASSGAGIVNSWLLGEASKFFETITDSLSTGMKRAARGQEEPLPAVSGSAKVGYEESGPLEAPRPLEKAATHLRVRVGED